MISLFLNTASSRFNAAIAKDNKVIDSICTDYDKDLSKDALLEIVKLLENNDFNVNDVDEIICVRGPGSFTGLRIGVTIAKTFAYFLGKDLYSVSSLDVMACSVSSDVIVPLIDARRGYVYASIYDKDYNVLMTECYIKLDDLLEKVKSYSGDTAFVSLDDFDFDTIKYVPDMDKFFSLNFKRKENSMTFVPEYLKKTEAEEKLNDNRNN